MKKGKILDTVLLILKIVLVALLLFPLVFFTYRMIESQLFDLAHLGEPGFHSGTGLLVFASFILLAGMNLILVVLGALGWLTAAKCKRSTKAFRVLTFAPIASQAAYLLISLLVMWITQALMG
jgi:hypothetical protein